MTYLLDTTAFSALIRRDAGMCARFASLSPAGSGMLDFEPELRRIQPDLFVVNEDGDVPEKQKLCRELGIDYVVLDRIPHGDLRARSTTDLRRIDQMPYRIDLAGGWLEDAQGLKQALVEEERSIMKGSQLQEYDQWLAKHLDELVAQYPGEVVAIQEGKVLHTGRTVRRNGRRRRRRWGE